MFINDTIKESDTSSI